MSGFVVHIYWGHAHGGQQPGKGGSIGGSCRVAGKKMIRTWTETVMVGLKRKV